MKSIIANNDITAKTVRLVSETTDVVSITVARNMADDRGLDLVVVKEGDIPVVKLVDLNKYIYEQKQADKAALKKQRLNTVGTKEIQFKC